MDTFLVIYIVFKHKNCTISWEHSTLAPQHAYQPISHCSHSFKVRKAECFTSSPISEPRTRMSRYFGYPDHIFNFRIILLYIQCKQNFIPQYSVIRYFQSLNVNSQSQYQFSHLIKLRLRNGLKSISRLTFCLCAKSIPRSVFRSTVFPLLCLKVLWDACANLSMVNYWWSSN